MASPSRGSADQVTFHLDIRGEEFLRFYRGEVASVYVLAADGRRVRFPAHALRPYVARDGVRGDFRLCFDSGGRMLSLDRLASSPVAAREVRA